MTELAEETGTRLTPQIGDRIRLSRPAVDPMAPLAEVWQERREKLSLVIDVTSGERPEVTAALLGTRDYWFAPVEDVEVVARAIYTDSGRLRAERLVEAEAKVVGLTAQVRHLAEQLAEAEYEREQAEAVAREMRDSWPPGLYLPGDAEPVVAEEDRTNPYAKPVVIGLGTGRIYRQQYPGEWYAPDLPSSVHSWEQILGDGPLLNLVGCGGSIVHLYDYVARMRKHESDTHAALWSFERAVADYVRLWQIDAPADRERPGSVEEARAILARAVHVLRELGRRAGRPDSP